MLGNLLTCLLHEEMPVTPGVPYDMLSPTKRRRVEAPPGPGTDQSGRTRTGADGGGGRGDDGGTSGRGGTAHGKLGAHHPALKAAYADMQQKCGKISVGKLLSGLKTSKGETFKIADLNMGNHCAIGHITGQCTRSNCKFIHSALPDNVAQSVARTIKDGVAAHTAAADK